MLHPVGHRSGATGRGPTARATAATPSPSATSATAATTPATAAAPATTAIPTVTRRWRWAVVKPPVIFTEVRRGRWAAVVGARTVP